MSYIRVPKLPAIDHSRTQKNGSMLPSKLLKLSMEAPMNPLTALSTSFYQDSVLATCDMRLPTSKPMTATQFSAMMHASGVSGMGNKK